MTAADANRPENGRGVYPLVSVVIPTYDRRKELEITLNSLRAQTYPNYEVLVCDDCSPDNTFSFLQDLEKEWPRLKVFRNEKNLNFNGTLKRLFSLATGEFIGMQHDHDIYKPEFLARMVALLQAQLTAGFACAAYDLLDEDGWLTEHPPLPECAIFADGLLPGGRLIKTLAYERYTPIAAMSILFRRRLVEQAGGYQTDWYLASDEDLYRRIATIADAAFCPDSVFVMRLRPRQRQRILGSWRSIYTLFLFRLSAAESLNERTGGSRSWAKCRQYYFKWKALFEESMSLWLRGETEQIKLATNTAALPPLPTKHAPLNGLERAILVLWTAALAGTVRVGLSVNKLRKRG